MADQHYTTRVDEVKALKREERYNEAENLLLELIDRVEEESRREGLGVAPWYYDQLAIIYRKQKRHQDERTLLERFAKQIHARGVQTPKLLHRLEEVRKL